MTRIRPAGKPEVPGGVGGDPGCRDEQALAPAAHAGRAASGQLDARQEAGQLVLVKSVFPCPSCGSAVAGRGRPAGPCGRSGGDLNDPVVFVTELVVGDRLGGRDMRRAALPPLRKTAVPGTSAPGASWLRGDRPTRRRTVPPGLPAPSTLRRQRTRAGWGKGSSGAGPASALCPV